MHGHSGDHAAEEERDLHLWQTEAGRGGDDEEVYSTFTFCIQSSEFTDLSYYISPPVL